MTWFSSAGAPESWLAPPPSAGPSRPAAKSSSGLPRCPTAVYIRRPRNRCPRRSWPAMLALAAAPWLRMMRALVPRRQHCCAYHRVTGTGRGWAREVMRHSADADMVCRQGESCQGKRPSSGPSCNGTLFFLSYDAEAMVRPPGDEFQWTREARGRCRPALSDVGAAVGEMGVVGVAIPSLHGLHRLPHLQEPRATWRWRLDLRRKQPTCDTRVPR